MTFPTTVPEQLQDILKDLREIDVDPLRLRLQGLPLEERLACLSSLDPAPMDTLGSLFDKLITVNLKMWHNQEVLYEIRRMTPEQFSAKWGSDLDGLHGVVKRCCDLNVQRAKLMDAVDVHFSAIVSGARPAEVFEQHKTY